MFLFPCVSLCFVTMATAARAELFSSAWCFNRFRPVPQHDAFGFFPAKTPSPAHLQTSLPLENVDERMTSGAIQA